MSLSIDTKTNAIADDTLALADTLTLATPSAPQVSLTFDDGTLDNDHITRRADLTVQAADGARVEYLVDGNPNDPTASWADAYNPDLQDGPHTVAVRQTVGGETSPVTTITFTIDRLVPAAPTVALAHDTGTDGDHLTNDAALTVTAETGARIEYQVDDRAWGAYDPNALADGEHTVKVRVMDAAGNTSPESAAFTFTLDKTRPADAVITVDDLLNAAEATATVALTITPDDDATIVSVLIDGSDLTLINDVTLAATPQESTFNATEMAQGPHTITVVTQDAAGNQTTTTRQFVIDTVAPQAPQVALAHDTGTDGDHLTNDAALTVTAEANATVEYQVDGGAWGAYDPNALADGEHTVKVRVKDAAGNMSPESAAFTFTLDKTGPQAADIGVDVVLNATEATAAVPVTITPDARATIVSAKIGNTNLTLTDGVYSFDATVLEDGEYTITVVTEDTAGNRTTTTKGILIDKTAPVAPTVALAHDTGTANDGHTRDGALTANAENGATFEYQLDNGTWSTIYAPEDLADGAHTVKVRATDGAGNVSQATTITFTIDKTVPTGANLSNQTVSEAAAIDTVVGILTAVDAGGTGHTFAIVDANGDPVADDLFKIVQNDDGAYEVRVKAALNHATAPTHTIRVKVSDGANEPAFQNLTITVTDVNDSTPTDIHVTGGLVAEKAPVGKEFATLSATDADAGDTFTYTLVTDETGTTPANNAFFEIVGNKIKVKAALNDAQIGLQEMWVKVTDAGGHAFVKLITIGVYNTEEAPEDVKLTLASETVNELAQNGTVVGTLTATDQDAGDHVTFRLVDDAGGRFDIVDGKLVVKNGLGLDYEQARTQKVTVEAKDDTGLVTLKTFTINLADVNPEVVNGTDANEAFVGGSGNDMLSGGAGKDALRGGTGNDTLAGGLDTDALTGGAGRDVFVFNTTLNRKLNVDSITDFNVRDDTIRLENGIFSKLTHTGTLSKAFFTIGPKAKDANDYIIYNNKTGELSYDADGSGRGAAVLFAKLAKGLHLTNADFVVI